MGVWYPSAGAAEEKRWGPFTTFWAWDGAPAEGLFPVILFSHGLMGRYRNHRDTAAALARAGYVVIIPQHAQDRWVGGSRTAAAIEHRIAELSDALRQLRRAAPDIAKIADRQTIGAVGYSLGGLTALGAGGVLPDIEYFESHCDAHGEEDPVFCLVQPWWEHAAMHAVNAAAALFSENAPAADKTDIRHLRPALDLRAAALIAPVAAVYAPAQLADMQAEIALFRMGQDSVNRFPFHAEHIHRALGDRAHVYKTYSDAHHFAFINQFPDWLLEKEHIPVAMDPAGFDRRAFLDEINTDIVRFFQRALPPAAH